MDKFVSNINGHFSGGAVELLVSSSIFNPVSMPTEDTGLPEYGNQQLQALVNF